ncbi:hypothetical protein HY78_08730 [Rhizorhabdus wittichii DC-6]|nr:hypothetical protein HY78_08730 [Rhizorhabdus wittichii DC-6]
MGMTNCQPMETMPRDRCDGRVVLIQTRSAVHRARFFPRSGEWCEVVTGGQILGAVGWADEQFDMPSRL